MKEASQITGLSIESLQKIEEMIKSRRSFCPDRIKRGLYMFCCKLGMHRFYFRTTPLETISKHIESIMAAEIIAINRGSKELDVDFVSEREDSSMYLVNDHHEKGIEIERRLEEKFPFYRLQSYRTPGIDLESHFRSYFVTRPLFPKADVPSTDDDIHNVAAREFIETTTTEARERYQRVLRESLGMSQPYIEFTDPVRDEIRIMVSIPRAGSYRFLSGISDIINNYGQVSKHKYAEPFANGRLIISIYLDAESSRPYIDDMVTDIGLIYVNPENELSPLIRNNVLSVHEAFYARSAWKFTHQFLSNFNTEYIALTNVLQEPYLIDILNTLRGRLVKDTYTESRIVNTIFTHPQKIRQLYKNFARRFEPNGQSKSKPEEISLEDVPHEVDRDILKFFRLFNDAVVKTNFYKKNKASLAFRFDPGKFLDPIEYKETPYGVFMILGKEFRGFHVRFRDIARGGIRIVKSRDPENYDRNSDSIFDENYNLAFTQQKKNKDIPEGGSKGTILLNPESQEMGDTAFEKYVDGLLDVIQPDEKIKDYLGKEEILFLGPDEGTAEFMSRASQRARERGYKSWKAFSTGKPLSEGGIPHDVYGMTTNSVHEYVLCTLRKLNIDEEAVIKVQTGGPDGDLGSNEILVSKDKTDCVIDGSGVLFDPGGLDRSELIRLAKKRVMAEHFDRSKLSRHGFFVHINDRNVTLPGGQTIENGLDFRNTFHLNPVLKADLFVPCGGRPRSINIRNWQELLDEKGTPRFKFIVEGANLFLTQPARLALEEKGVIIFKDASANKGGVTSSSLEVLVSLALTDEEYDKHMCVNNGRVPAFRKSYVSDVLEIIRNNARLEFEVLWQENKSIGTPLSILTDQLSDKINKLTDSIHESDLGKDKALLRAVVEQHCPPALVKMVGIDEILRRVPGNYLQAIFSSWLASHFIYDYGLQADEIDFHKFLEQLVPCLKNSVP
jgi:glutamate dehydrogenase